MAKSKRNTNQGGKLLEQVVSMLHVAGFQQVLWRDYRNSPHAKVIVADWPYKTIYFGCDEGGEYAGKGKHEWYIQSPKAKALVECKFQAGGGSVDEKLPYIRDSWLNSPHATWEHKGELFHSPSLWFVVFGGEYFKKGRGLAGVGWLKREAARLSNAQRHMFVTQDVRELAEQLKTTFLQD